MMKPCCQNAHENQPENGMLGESSCPIGDRMGGATKFEAGVTCEEFEAAQWGQEEKGCCYKVGFGAMNKPCCQNAHDAQPANGMLGASKCPTGNLLGGAVMFEAGVTCEDFESQNWGVEEEEDQGCCYNVGFGAMMKPCCQGAHDAQPENGMLGESKCPVGNRMGGATRFESGVTCEEFEGMNWGEEKQGCCYSMGFGAMMKPCCQAPHQDQPENGMLGESACPTGDLMGGAVRFEEGVTCEEFEGANWGVEPEVEAFTLKTYKRHCKGLSGKECRASGCRVRGDDCKGKNKPNCKRVKDMDVCAKIPGCTAETRTVKNKRGKEVTRSKCSGSVKWE